MRTTIKYLLSFTIICATAFFQALLAYPPKIYAQNINSGVTRYSLDDLRHGVLIRIHEGKNIIEISKPDANQVEPGLNALMIQFFDKVYGDLSLPRDHANNALFVGKKLTEINTFEAGKPAKISYPHNKGIVVFPEQGIEFIKGIFIKPNTLYFAPKHRENATINSHGVFSISAIKYTDPVVPRNKMLRDFQGISLFPNQINYIPIRPKLSQKDNPNIGFWIRLDRLIARNYYEYYIVLPVTSCTETLLTNRIGYPLFKDVWIKQKTCTAIAFGSPFSVRRVSVGVLSSDNGKKVVENANIDEDGLVLIENLLSNPDFPIKIHIVLTQYATITSKPYAFIRFSKNKLGNKQTSH